MIKLSLPVRVVSELNTREHWAAKHKRKKAQQAEVWAAWPRRQKVTLPCLVRFVRYGQNLLDPDAVASSFKHVQDEVCRLLGVDDGNTQLISFEYSQVALHKRKFSIEINVEPIGAIK